MKKNVASQIVGAQLVSKTDGSPVTSGTTTVYVTLDGGTQATGTVGSGAATHEGHGYWTYTPSQAETNGDLAAFTFENSSAVNATVQIYTSFPQTGDNYARLGAPAGASLSADVAAVKVDTAAIKVQSDKLTFTVANHLDVNVLKWLGGTIPAVNVTGVPLVDLKYTLGTISPAAAGSVRADAVTGAVGSVTGAVGSVASGGIAAASFAAGAIDASAIASNAITAAKIAADAITDAKVASDVTIASVTGAVGSVTGNVGGNVVGSVGSVATGGIVAASFGAGAIDASAIAANAIGASELATDAVAEIADAVWDELLSGHAISGSTGEGLSNAGAAGTPPTVSEIADEVQTRTIAAVTTVTNLTNAPTSGDLTATMKASVTTAASASTPALSTAGNAAVADKLLGRNLAGGSDGTRTVKDALRSLRNKTSIAGGTLTVTEEDDSTPAWTATVTTAAGDPLSSIDPA